jgi:cytochrome c-type biogenesis protein
VLGTILIYASTADTLADGVTLLAFYSLGLGLPLFATAMGVDRFLASFKRVRRYQNAMSTVSGLFLVIFGLIVYDDSLTLLTSFFERHGIGSYLDD